LIQLDVPVKGLGNREVSGPTRVEVDL
jgi:hypothetical protein